MRRRKEKRSLPAQRIHIDLAPNIAQIVRNLIVRHDGIVTASYRLGSVRWDFTGQAAQSVTLDAVTDVWANLAGRDMRERVTTQAFPVAAWARQLDERTPHPLPPMTIDGHEESWAAHLVRMQRRIALAGMDDKIVIREFTVGKVDPGHDVRSEVMAYIADASKPLSNDVRLILAEEKRVADAVAAAGWRARRARPTEIGWLHQRSTAPGMPPVGYLASDGGWDGPDLALLTNDVRWHETAWDRTVEVHGWRGGREFVRHVQVLTAARMGDLNYPYSGLEPWQAFAERAVDPEGRPFPIEWSITGRLMTGEELAKRAELDKRKAIHLADQYRQHGEPPPGYTHRGIVAATEAEDQITTGNPREAGRFVGTVNLIVSGEAVVDDRGNVLKSAAEVCEERADAARRLFGGNALKMHFTPPPGQAARLAETIPGEKFDTAGFQRQIRLPYLAAGLPNVTTHVGDGRGPYLGYTLGARRRPVNHDPHFATEGRGELGRGNNLWPIIGSLGSGKSVLLAALIYGARRRDIDVIVRDPSGPLSALCAMPELRVTSQAVDLLRGRHGILNVPSLVREPTHEEFGVGEGGTLNGDDGLHGFHEARKRASAERQALVIDTARRALDHDLYAHAETLGALRTAARVVGGDTGWTVQHSLWHLVDALVALGDPHAKQLADALTDAADMPVLSLLFPERGEPGDMFLPQQAAGLTVISTPGIKRAPDEALREDWSPDERAADAVLRLTALYADRLLFRKKRSARAIAIFDEAEDLTDSGTGRGYLSRLGRDHSKWNIAVYLALKSLSNEMLSGELRNFIAGAWIGRQANEDMAATMLSILNIGERAYAKTLMRLSETAPGEFVHLDAEGNVGGMKVDVDFYPPLRATVLTNPTPEGSDAWRIDSIDQEGVSA